MQLKRRGTINPLKARKHYRWVKMMFWNTTAQWKQGAPAAVTWLVSESFISQWNPVSTHRGTELVCSSGEVVWNITLLMEISLLPFEQGAQAFSIIWISLSSEFSYHHQPISLHHLSWHFVPEISSLIWCLPNKVPCVRIGSEIMWMICWSPRPVADRFSWAMSWTCDSHDREVDVLKQLDLATGDTVSGWFSAPDLWLPWAQVGVANMDVSATNQIKFIAGQHAWNAEIFIYSCENWNVLNPG